jgi:DNA invertase Pin-like site-specific DNA recombinase
MLFLFCPLVLLVACQRLTTEMHGPGPQPFGVEPGFLQPEAIPCSCCAAPGAIALLGARLCTSIGYTQLKRGCEALPAPHEGRFRGLETTRKRGLEASETNSTPSPARPMPHYGYARVSTIDQDLALQRAALKAAGCDVIRAEKVSGARRDERTELQVLLDFLRQGDTLVVTRIDRLARSVKDLQDMVHELKAKGAKLKATEQPIDTGTAAGQAFLDMLGVFAEFETNLRRERQLEGIAAAKARGVYKGRQPIINSAEVQRLSQEEQLGATAIARRLGIGRASVYRVLGRPERLPVAAE